MARIFTSGAESLSPDIERASKSSAVTYDSAFPRSGRYAYKHDTGAGATSAYVNPLTSATAAVGYLRFWLLISSYPATELYLAQSANWQNGVGLRLTSSGTLRLYKTADVQIGSDSVVVTPNVYHKLELFWDANAASGSRTLTARLDDTQFASATNLTTDIASVASFYVGNINTPPANYVFYTDDIAVNSNTGSFQNSWAGDGKIVLLKPVSDNTRSTLWTGGTGGTTNLWDAVDNMPPVGTATETNTTQIEHAGNAAGTTDEYSANMTTYNEVGIGPNDTIQYLDIRVAHGEDVATGTKFLSFDLVSNPTVTAGTFGLSSTAAGGDIGALGTFPTNWVIGLGSPQYNQSVTVTTPPVMRVIRPETASRVASVCAMFMFVESTPVHSFVPELVTAPQIALQRAP